MSGFRLIIVVIFIFPSIVRGQSRSEVPDLFDQFFNNYYLLNPAAADTSYKFKIRGENRTQTGLFEGISKLYADADFKIREKEGRSQFIGLQAVNFKEGDFINRSRLYGRYSWRTNLSEYSSLSAGAALGIVNYNFRGSQAGAGGSSTVMDGCIGIWYSWKRLYLGVAGQQILRNQLQPINQQFQLERYWNCNMFYSFHISHVLDFTPHLYTRLQKGTDNVQVAGVFDIYDLVSAGVNLKYKRGVAFIAGIKNIKVGNSTFSLYASYLAGTNSPSILDDNAVEFYLSFQR